MKLNTNRLDYFSLFLNLSFFLLHNIYIVFIGIILSLYLINKNIIKKYKKLITDKKLINNSNKINNKRKAVSSSKESKEKDLEISLVETIEESGYIPSIDSKDNNIAA